MSIDASIIGRMVLQGTIKLMSPLLIGDGTGDENLASTRDIHVLKNKEELPFIPGTSLAGVLRDTMLGLDLEAAEELFGNADEKNGQQSLLQIDDVVLENAKIVTREGVRIDSYTGTAVQGAKFDYEVVDRGATGTLFIGVVIRQKNAKNLSEIRKAFIVLRETLKSGIWVGAMTAKGFGEIKLESYTSGYYDFSKLKDVKAWLADAQNIPENATDKLKDKVEQVCKEKDYFSVEADFAINSAMLIREMDVPEQDKENEKEKENKITASFKKSGDDFVIPGTSMKGVMRHHAEYILDKMEFQRAKANDIINELMGYSESDEKKAKSRLCVKETYFKDGVKEFVQPRTKIDRFTGGVVRSALFSTKPVWQKEKGKAILKICFSIRKSKDYEVGLAMLLLRDMWLGRIAIGGEKSIGRGTLQGVAAKVSYNGEYELGENGRLIKGDKNDFEACVKALINKSLERA